MSKPWVHQFIARRSTRTRNQQRRKNKKRRLLLQGLESRQLLAGDVISSPVGDSVPGLVAPPSLQPSSMPEGEMGNMQGSSHQHGAHQAALALISADQATHTVVASGNWSDPNVWENQTLPTEGARIIIPQGMTLTVDSELSTEFKTIGIHGTLRFATDVNTELRVDTIVSSPHGRFEMGTTANPIPSDITAKVVFADDGAIDTTWDPEQLSRGAVLHGPTEIHGAETTHRVTLAEFPTAGTSTIQLTNAPVNWNVGDEIVVTGTQGATSDEVRRIQSIDGSSVTLDSALQQDHVPPKSDLNVYVANRTRNVQFSSENADVPRRGHIMLMHTLDVDIQNAEFTDLGRTNKNRELDDLLFTFPDVPGNFTSAPVVYEVTNGPRTNVRGRYAVHFHRGGVDPSSKPALVSGSVINGSPGWGLVNHSSNVDMINNVTYGVQGAAFYTEVGDEIGSMVGNIAIRTVSPSFTLDDSGAIDPDLRLEQMDFGVDGDGFWLSGHMVSMRDNVAAGASAHGIIIWSDGVIEPDLARGRSSVKVANVANGNLITGRDTIPTWWAPLAEIKNNESYGAIIGFRSRYVHSQGYLGEIGSAFHTAPDQAYIDTLNPTIDGLTVWDSRDGVLMNYNERMSIKNARLIGIGAPYVLNGGTADTGVGIDMYNEVTRGPGVIENVSIEGYNMGLLAPRQDEWRLNNLQLRNTTDMMITEMIEGPRKLEMTNITFGSLDGTAVADQATNRRNIVMNAQFESNHVHPFNFLMADQVTLDGQQLYFNQQAADFVPTAGEIAASPGPVPANMIGLSNQQLKDRFGTSFGGAIIPADATPADFLVGGVVGGIADPPATSPPIYHPASESAGPAGLIIDPGNLTNFDGPVAPPFEDGGGDDDDDSDDDGGDGTGDDDDDSGDDGGDGTGDDDDDSDDDGGDGTGDEDDDSDDDGGDGTGDDDDDSGDDGGDGTGDEDDDSDDDGGDGTGDDDDDSDDDGGDGTGDEDDDSGDDGGDGTGDDDDDSDDDGGDGTGDEDDDSDDDGGDGTGDDDDDSDDDGGDGTGDEDDDSDDDGGDGTGDDDDDSDDDGGDGTGDDDDDSDDDGGDGTSDEDDDSDDDGGDGTSDEDDDSDDDGGDGTGDDDDDSDDDGGDGTGDDDDDSDDDGGDGTGDEDDDSDNDGGDGTGDDDESGFRFHNGDSPTDVNNDGRTTAGDALVIINFLNRFGNEFLATLQVALQHYVDVNNDGSASASDALQIINTLARLSMSNTEAEAVDVAMQMDDLGEDDDEQDELIDMLSQDLV